MTEETSDQTKPINTGLKWAILGASLFAWPIALGIFVWLVSPMSGDIFLVLALPVLASFFVGTIMALLAAVQGISALVSARKTALDGTKVKVGKAWASVIVGIAPVIAGVIFLVVLFGPVPR